MPFDKPPFPSPQEALPDLDNEDVVVNIFEVGSEDEMERLRRHIEARDHITISRERMELKRQFARQRRHLISRSNAETAERLALNPKATELEYTVGAYRERLEAPVRDAVFMLRQKGYASYESGFNGLEAQQISFMPPVTQLGTHPLSDRVRAAFEAVEAEPYVSDEAIGFNMHKLIPDDELTSLWNLLISDLPTLDQAQRVTSLPSAIGFRQKQDARFKKDAAVDPK